MGTSWRSGRSGGQAGGPHARLFTLRLRQDSVRPVDTRQQQVHGLLDHGRVLHPGMGLGPAVGPGHPLRSAGGAGGDRAPAGYGTAGRGPGLGLGRVGSGKDLILGSVYGPGAVVAGGAAGRGRAWHGGLAAEQTHTPSARLAGPCAGQCLVAKACPADLDPHTQTHTQTAAPRTLSAPTRQEDVEPNTSLCYRRVAR